MATLRNRFVFPLQVWRGAAFEQKRLQEGDVQVIFKQMRLSGYKFVQNVVVKSYSQRSQASASQLAARQRFTQAWQAVATVLADPTKAATAQAEFDAQFGKKGFYYFTLRGYVFAREYAKL